MAKSIGILYICSGQYITFWKDFYDSFEDKFLNNTIKHYFVFTDHKNIYQKENPRVHIHSVDNLPWPLPTLLKYHMFLEYKVELKNMDYLYQSNANIICSQTVTEEEFLPDGSEEVFFTIHPGFLNVHSEHCPFERRKESAAYVPHSKKAKYVFGAMNGGRSNSYLEMIQNIENNIEIDLKKNIIAKWHDESYVNHYAAYLENKKLLSPAYCYPVGFEVKYPKKIIGVEKSSRINLDKIKGMGKKQKYIVKVMKYCWRYMCEYIFKFF